MNKTLAEIATLVKGTLQGDGEVLIKSLSTIADATKESLVFASDKDYFTQALDTDAAAIITDQMHQDCSKSQIVVSNPKLAFARLLEEFDPQPRRPAMIHPTACIADNVTLGDNCHIGAYVVIESGASIGSNCQLLNHVSIGRNVSLGNDVTLHPKVTVYDDCKLGDNVIIHSGSVVGSDGFGYEFADGKHHKIPHIGNATIEDDVEIGANTVIDRATLGSTSIGKGTKIDNFVQIAHSVRLGQNNILCAFTGVAGSTKSGDNVIFAANVGVSDHVTIEDNVILGARTGVPPKKTLKSGQIYLGNPSRPKDKAIEAELSATRIPMMRKQLKTLQTKVKELEKRLVE